MNKANEVNELELVFPTLEYKKQVEEYLQEFLENGEYKIAGCGGLDRIKDYDEWLKKIQKDLLDKNLDEGKVKATVYLTVRKRDNRVVGNLQIRHRLNEKLLNYGGHIGDSIRPSERKKGYATQQIRLALEKCKELGIDNVLMDCDKTNIGSRKSIINNGGILENEVYINDELVQRYWISLKKKFVTNIINKTGVIDANYRIKSFKTDEFKGDIALININKMDKPYVVESANLCIADDNYKWLEFYDYNKKYKLTAMYDENDEPFEWYFDIARRIGKENGLPYEDDLYLDVVVTPNGETILLDEDELYDAYKRLEVSKSEYDMAYEEANQLIAQWRGKAKELKLFTDRVLKEF